MKRIRCQIDVAGLRGTAINMIVETVLKSTAAEAEADVQPFSVVALFCGVGLVASLFLVALGIDIPGAIL
jgi:hypothetical protein